MVGNKEKSKKSPQSFSDVMLHVRKCPCCQGKDGKAKDVYETLQSALDTAQYIEKDRYIYLNVYKCPHGNGWHLTKNNASSEIIERQEAIFQNNSIPLKSSDGSWEYIREEPDTNNTNNGIDTNYSNKIISKQKQKNNQPLPIIKVECEPGIHLTLHGKVIEIIENINIEKIFGIDIENVFFANMTNNIFDGIMSQITIYVENKEKSQQESYTILIKKKLLKKNKIIKGHHIKITIIGKSINNIKRWCSHSILE